MAKNDFDSFLGNQKSHEMRHSSAPSLKFKVNTCHAVVNVDK